MNCKGNLIKEVSNWNRHNGDSHFIGISALAKANKALKSGCNIVNEE